MQVFIKTSLLLLFGSERSTIPLGSRALDLQLEPCRVRSKLVAFRQLLIVLNVLDAPFQGFILFLFSSQLCCGGKIIQSYGPSSQCCGYLAYNSQTSFCYGGSIYKKCQYKSYDPASFVCCDKTLVLRHGGNNTRCCGQKSYDR